EDLIAVLAANDDLFRAQHGQMLRNVGLLQTKPLVDSADGHLPLVAEQFHNGDTAGMGQGLEDPGFETAQIVLHPNAPGATRQEHIFEISNIVNRIDAASAARGLATTIFARLVDSSRVDNA